MSRTFPTVPAFAVLLATVACTGSSPAPPEVSTSPAPQAETSAVPAREWDPWEEARSRGIEFRAIGQEPGWYLEIDNERWMRLLYAYGELTVTTPVPSAVHPGQSTTLEESADGHVLRVHIVGQNCADAMSGQPFPATVTVTIDGTALKGCGRWLTP